MDIEQIKKIDHDLDKISNSVSYCRFHLLTREDEIEFKNKFDEIRECVKHIDSVINQR